jgi:dolichol-phosphate mannosyltransferase
MLVQLVVLAGLVIAGVHYLAATALAVETAVLNNFMWHEWWTWRDRTRAHPDGMLPRLVRFNLTVGAISIVENIVLMNLFVGYLSIHFLAGNMISIAVCGVANFIVSDRLVFRRSRPRVGTTEEMTRCRV